MALVSSAAAVVSGSAVSWYAGPTRQADLFANVPRTSPLDLQTLCHGRMTWVAFASMVGLLGWVDFLEMVKRLSSRWL